VIPEIVDSADVAFDMDDPYTPQTLALKAALREVFCDLCLLTDEEWAAKYGHLSPHTRA
jgi:hypothetical protein